MGLGPQFAATACTIVSGAIAERARVEAYAIYSFFMAAWVYPVIVHSVWSSAGWASMFRCAASLLLTPHLPSSLLLMPTSVPAWTRGHVAVHYHLNRSPSRHICTFSSFVAS